MWDAIISSHTDPGSAGLLQAFLDAAVSSRQSESAAASRAATNQSEHDTTQLAIGALNDISIPDVQTALDNQGYTAARSALIDNLDATISSVIAAISALNDPSVAAIADAVWDEAIAGHLAPGSTGEALDNAKDAADADAIADAGWIVTGKHA